MLKRANIKDNKNKVDIKFKPIELYDSDMLDNGVWFSDECNVKNIEEQNLSHVYDSALL